MPVSRLITVATATALLIGTISVPATAAIELPPVGARADYQLGGAYPPAAGVKIVTRDRTSAAVPGTYSICYVNAFQTQSDATSWWRRAHQNLLLRDARGRLVTDDQWNEVLFDISKPAKRKALAKIVGRWINGCARKGFRAVEPDNLDSYTRSRGLLRRAHAVAYSQLLARRAHRKGLAIAQKNDTRLVSLRRRIGFDFAVVEECQAYSECAAFTRRYGRHVIEIEYPDNGGLANFETACRLRGQEISVLYRDRELVAAGKPGYVARWC